MQRRIEIELENMAHLSRPYLTEVNKYRLNFIFLFNKKDYLGRR